MSFALALCIAYLFGARGWQLPIAGLILLIPVAAAKSFVTRRIWPPRLELVSEGACRPLGDTSDRPLDTD